MDGSLTQYNLTGLHPGSTYTLQLQAEGGGQYTSAISTEFTTGTSLSLRQCCCCSRFPPTLTLRLAPPQEPCGTRSPLTALRSC